MPTPEWVKQIREQEVKQPLMAVSVNAVIFDTDNRVLLQKLQDDDTWGLPGGILELEESLLDAVLRETKEETGLDVEVIRMTGIYSKQPLHTYPNGDKVNFVTVVFECRQIAGKLGNQDGEATEVAFFPIDNLPKKLHPKFIPRIQDATSDHPYPCIV